MIHKHASTCLHSVIPVSYFQFIFILLTSSLPWKIFFSLYFLSLFFLWPSFILNWRPKSKVKVILFFVREVYFFQWLSNVLTGRKKKDEMNKEINLEKYYKHWLKIPINKFRLWGIKKREKKNTPWKQTNSSHNI